MAAFLKVCYTNELLAPMPNNQRKCERIYMHCTTSEPMFQPRAKWRYLANDDKWINQCHELSKAARTYIYIYIYISPSSSDYGSETWPMKVQHELKMNCTEMSMIRWMCGVKLNERKKSEELRELLGLEPVSLMIIKGRLRWFGQVERKDDNDWVKRCITWEFEGIWQRGCPKKTWWDCVKNDMELRGQPVNSGSLGKMAIKTECVYVCALQVSIKWKPCLCVVWAMPRLPDTHLQPQQTLQAQPSS